RIHTSCSSTTSYSRVWISICKLFQMIRVYFLCLALAACSISAQQPQQQQWNNWNPFAQWAQQGNQLQNWNGQQHQVNTQGNVQEMRRAKAREIYGIPGQRNANQKLRTCCRQQTDADAECRRRFCDFDAVSSNQVIQFLAQCGGPDKGWTMGRIWNCVSSRVDHRACCSRQGVIPACMAYCETTGQVPTDFVNHAVCIGQFDKIRFCFREYLDTNPNLEGDT
ncbi:hypothetical protein PENTCL1PPCAC_5112, partial [Pristionchus entomophagus]